MATFLEQQPQPGDGSWLLLNANAPTSKPSRRRNRCGPKKAKKKVEQTFLERHDSVADEEDVSAPAQALSSSLAEAETHASGLARPATSKLQTPAVKTPAVKHDKHNTAPANALPVNTAPANLVITHTATATAHIALAQTNKRHRKQFEMPGKAIPPHLRKKNPPAAPLPFRTSGILPNSQIPKGDPKRWETDWLGLNNEPQRAGWAGESDHSTKKKGDGNSVNSARADGGHGVKISQGAADGGWEPHHLQDYDGKFAPAPVDWDSRPAFRANQSAAQVQQWLDCHEDVLLGVSRQPILDDLSVVDGFTYTFASKKDPREGTEYKPMGDIVPRHWIPETYGRLPPKTFWDEVTRSAPAPTDVNDLDGVRPWWEDCVPGGSFLRPVTPPHIARVDPDETKEETMKRVADRGSLQHAENRRRYELSKLGITQEKVMRKAEKDKKKAARIAANGGRTPDSLKAIKPSLPRLFLRHATSGDAGAIRDIYNYYIDFTCSAYETKRLDKADFVEQIADINASDLPFIVAVERGEVIKASRKKKHRRFEEDEQIVMADKIVGFAYADDYISGNDMFRFTVSMEVWVHNQHYMKGVAKCLVDKLLAMLDPEYIERGGYHVTDETLEAAKPQRLIKNVVVNFSHDKPEKLVWVGNWLSESGFKQVGYFESIGVKYGREVHQAIFKRTTGAVLDVQNPPEAN